MKSLNIGLLTSLVVSFVSVGFMPAHANTKITEESIVAASRAAYMRTYEAKVCIDATANRRFEVAMGFCYSWYMQALDAHEKTAAYLAYAAAVKAIEDGIADERY